VLPKSEALPPLGGASDGPHRPSAHDRQPRGATRGGSLRSRADPEADDEEAGAVVLSTARAVVAGIDDLRASVKGLRQGLEAEVTLVVDVMLPTARLAAFEAISSFAFMWKL
jgi:hypothetical protein